MKSSMRFAATAAVVLSVFILRGTPAAAASLLLDDFESASNKLGGRSNTYIMAPSRALAIQSEKDFKEGKFKTLEQVRKELGL